MSEDPTMQDYLEAAKGILEDLLRHLEFTDAQVEATIEDDQIYFQIVTTEAGRLIGRTSQTLGCAAIPAQPAVVAHV
jgi:predicted RNA-binding protein Jag